MNNQRIRRQQVHSDPCSKNEIKAFDRLIPTRYIPRDDNPSTPIRNLPHTSPSYKSRSSFDDLNETMKFVPDK